MNFFSTKAANGPSACALTNSGKFRSLNQGWNANNSSKHNFDFRKRISKVTLWKISLKSRIELYRISKRSPRILHGVSNNKLLAKICFLSITTRAAPFTTFRPLRSLNVIDLIFTVNHGCPNVSESISASILDRIILSGSKYGSLER